MIIFVIWSWLLFSKKDGWGDWINSRITNGEAELCSDAFALKNIIVMVTRVNSVDVLEYLCFD